MNTINKYITIKGASENNLKNISVKIPKNKLVVLTGLSGSGKSTLALSTLQKECQRQYMESMGMITDLISKPKVDSIEGLSPSISIDQRNTNKNPRSTVGTITEIFTYLRILFAKLGMRKCPSCRALIYQAYESEREDTGFSEHDCVLCAKCGTKVPQLQMSHFSFNKPEGACPTCKGIGALSTPDIEKIMDVDKSIIEGAVYEWDTLFIERYKQSLESAGKYYDIHVDTSLAIKDYETPAKMLLFYGVADSKFLEHVMVKNPPKTVAEGSFPGIITGVLRRFNDQPSKKIKGIFSHSICPECKGDRLRKESASVTIGGMNIIELSKKSLFDVLQWIQSLPDFIAKDALLIAKPIIDDLEKRVVRILDVGVGYLSLDRQAPTLSPGEAQRLRLASLLGSGLTGVLYVLDEPTTGLHSRDTDRLIKSMQQLVAMGNTVLVIEHDVEMMRAADYIIDFGPGSGKEGGEIIAVGKPEDVAKCENSITGQYILGKDVSYLNQKKRRESGKAIEIKGARAYHLKNIDVAIPLGLFVSVTGVSGSGKSSLIFDILDKGASLYFNKSSQVMPGDHDEISGFSLIDGVITIDQSPIGRTPRSNAATYTDVFKYIRDFYGALGEKEGVCAKDFSFNVPGGRCEKCQGAGVLSIPMHFLPDVTIQCPACRGRRFQEKVLMVTYKGYSIADILEMSIGEAYDVFSEVSSISKRLGVLKAVGLGYLVLGQPANTVSGGEAQRIKLAKELGKSAKGHILYLFDEPTTGLHPHDVKKIINLFQRLVDQGHSVVAIEHNIDVIEASDWVIDFGPEGGMKGGEIIGEGTPLTISGIQGSQTGAVLRKLGKHRV